MATSNSETYNPGQDYLGGYTPNDGSIEFYSRVKSQVTSKSVVLDLGAGRASWFEEDPCLWRVHIRTLKGVAKELIGADVDVAILANRSTDRNIVIDNGIDLPAESVDVIVADYVLEHIDRPEEFLSEINRILVPGGVFCARTPHKFHYVSIGAMMTRNSQHGRMIRWLQPRRKEIDVFPTKYRLNTLTSINHHFVGYQNFSYLRKSDPAYFFGSKLVFKTMSLIHKFLPAPLCSNIFVFMKKNDDRKAQSASSSTIFTENTSNGLDVF